MDPVDASGAVIDAPTTRTELLTIRHGDRAVPAALTGDPTGELGACLVVVPPADYHGLHDARSTWKARGSR